jgi:SOS-response transcriptional repressor LexA
MPANDRFKPIRIEQDNTLVIWGIVTFVIKDV